MVCLESRFSSGTDFVFEYHTLERGHTVPKHWHSYLEFEVVLCGHGTALLGDEAVGIAPGSAWLMTIDPRSVHCIRVDDDAEMVLASLSFGTSVLDASLARRLSRRLPVCRFDAGALSCMESRFRLLSSEERSFDYGALYVSSVINSLIIDYFRCCGVRSSVSKPVDEAERIIREKYTEPLSLTAVASTLSVTPNYLGRIFRETTGLTFSEYLSGVRLREACRLLSEGGNVKEAALCSGFSSAEYFCSVFKKVMKKTPGEWKKSSVEGT